MSPRAVMKTQPQMIRSNSSGGVTMNNSNNSMGKLQRHRTAADGSMSTFSSFRGTSGSPKRSFNPDQRIPALADLEFPPPPLDLPPPVSYTNDLDIVVSNSDEMRNLNRKLFYCMQSTPDDFDSNSDMMQQISSLTPSNDVSNTEPSVEEASSRFGVSLRRREPSTDSCSSLGSPATGMNTELMLESIASGGNTKSKEKSEPKFIAEMKERNELYQRKQIGDVPNINFNNNNSNSSSNSNHINNNNSNSSSGSSHNNNNNNCNPLQTSGNNNTNNGSLGKTTPSHTSVDHVSQLVNELAEITKKSAVAAITPIHEPNGGSGAVTNANNFKAQLKRVEPKKMQSVPQTAEPNTIVDFKSRLRRVENTNDADGSGAGGGGGGIGGGKLDEPILECKRILDAADENDVNHCSGQNKMQTKRNGDQSKGVNNEQDKILNSRKKSLTEPKVIDKKKTEMKSDLTVNDKDGKGKRDADTKSGTATMTVGDEEDKRKSTGSISSLKKLWEAKEGNSATVGGGSESGQTQLSPKMASKGAIPPGGNNNKTSDDDYDASGLNKKPAVPTKPKLTSIYATPIQVKLNADTASATPANTPTINTNNNSNVQSTQVSRESILDLIQLVEGTLKAPINSISASQWLQLSDKLNILHCSCVTFADKATMAPHSKFQFRELVTRVENQSRSLRSAGSKNIQDNEKLVSEVGQSLKQISNALHR